MNGNHLRGALQRAALIRLYADRLCERLTDHGTTASVEEARSLLDRLDDIAVEVEACRAEVRAVYPRENLSS
jgi:hypothetical protein